MKIQSRTSRRSTNLLVLIGLLGTEFGIAAKMRGTVVKEVDGDTLWVERERGDIAPPKPEILKIRMIGMDSAESCFVATGGCVAQGHFGADAKAALGAMVPVGTRVTVDDKGTDKYNRTLGRVFLQQTDINLEMVRGGEAVTYIICEGESCNKKFLTSENVRGYSAACHSARENGLGIWNPADPLLELPFEFRMRLSGRVPDKFVGDIQSMNYVQPEDYKSVDACDRIFFKSEADAEKAGFSKR